MGESALKIEGHANNVIYERSFYWQMVNAIRSGRRNILVSNPGTGKNSTMAVLYNQ
jgi:MoxR-like ATPase